MSKAEEKSAAGEAEEFPVPLFTCRPFEFPLLRASIPDRATYCKTYMEYLEENHRFVEEMSKKPGHVVIRGTWDVKDFLDWCEKNNESPRSPARMKYFEERAKQSLRGEIDDPVPSFSEYVCDSSAELLRYCCNPACKKLEDQPKQFATCQRCGCNVYCSRECQKVDWKAHKSWCKAPLA